MDAPKRDEGEDEPTSAPAPKRQMTAEEIIRLSEELERREREVAERERALAQAAARTVAPAPRDKTPEQVAKEVLVDVAWKLPDEVVLSHATLAADNVHKNKLNGVMAIPGKGSESKPAMLFYKLKADDQVLSKGGELFPDWTEGEDCKIVLGPSGASKTRKLYEFLVKHRGYFLAWKDANDKNHGSLALSSVLDEAFLQQAFPDVDWTTQLTERSDVSFLARRNAVRFAVQCVLGAYALVYKAWELWQAAQPKSIGRIRRPKFEASHWLLAQLFPVHFFGRDVFELLACKLAEQCPRTSFDSAIFHALSTSKFYCVIDEAQELGRRMQKTFNTTNSDRLSFRPLLSPVLEGVRKTLGRHPIVSGTGLSLMREWKSLVSGMTIGTPTARFVFTDFQTLTVEETKTLLTKLLRVKGQTCVYEAAEWLAGRPRFVATFIEDVATKNLTIDSYLKEFVALNTALPVEDLDSRIAPRTPAEALRRLSMEPGETRMMGAKVFNPYRQALTDMFWLSAGQLPRRAHNPALIEFGLAYAAFFSNGGQEDVDAEVRPEALVLEAAHQRLMTFSREEFYLDLIRDVQDSPSAMGERFEVLVAELLVDAFCGLDFETHRLLSGIAVPDTMKGQWERPPWRYGRFAIKGDDGFYAWINQALDPSEEILRIRFPGTNGGPDIVFVLHSADRKRTLLVLVQCKFEKEASDTEGALYTVDPFMLHSQLRGTEKQRVIKEHQADHAALMTRLANVAVFRMLVSGAANVETKTSLVSYKRGGRQGNDLQIIVDARHTEELFGSAVANELKKLKQ